MIIRREEAPDRPEILALVRAAFPEPDEARLLQRLFASREYIRDYSLVAESDRGEVLGYVVSTRGWIGKHPALALSLVAVAPGYQRQGIGSALINETIAVANTQQETAIALVGSGEYFPRFGFAPADSLGIVSPDRSWGSLFMALPLAGFSPAVHGHFKYAAAFGIP